MLLISACSAEAKGLHTRYTDQINEFYNSCKKLVSLLTADCWTQSDADRQGPEARGSRNSLYTLARDVSSTDVRVQGSQCLATWRACCLRIFSTWKISIRRARNSTGVSLYESLHFDVFAFRLAAAMRAPFSLPEWQCLSRDSRLASCPVRDVRPCR